MRENLKDIYRVLTTDETLLRLLHYKPEDANDDPLDVSKPNILDMSDADKWGIINDKIVTTYKVTDLVDKDPKCRILFYPGRRSGTGNYMMASQDIVIDVFVHMSFDIVDLRLSWICDRLSDLLFKKDVTGANKMSFREGRNVRTNKDADSYVGYEMVYHFGSVN